MAEAALGEIAKALLTQLASPAMKEFKLLWGHENELKKLGDTVNTIKNVLEDAEQRRPTDTTVQGWLARLKDVLYDADNLFDSSSYEALHEKVKTGNKIAKEVCRLLLKPYRFAFVVKHSRKVKAIREHLDYIAEDINKFGLLTSWDQNDQEQPNRFRRDQTHSYFPSSEVVGRDQEREDMVKLLLPDNCEGTRGVSVVAVIGMGGLGKTTLGQFVYDDERVKQGFDLCMWCCVNYFSDLKVSLESIIKSATGSAAPERLDVEQLQIKLRDAIGGKRFLLVLDDVWDEDAQNWHKLQILLNSGKVGSVVLATTRSVKVAQSMRAAKPYFHLQGLTDDSAWLLFKKIAFGEESEEQKCQDMEQLGRHIVKKCGNSPLATVIIASMLRDVEKNKWFPLFNDELSKVVPAEHGKVMQVLKMSYSTLPSPIKRCFAYCSLFHKDHAYDKGKLVHLWIAQGFVDDCAAGRSLEDVAEDYFFYLVNRCFIQNCEGKSSFRLHDLVHDLASEVAGAESILVDKIDPNFGDNTPRHVSQYSALVDSSIKQLYSFSQLKRLRTFLLVHTMGQHKIKNVDELISCFKAVRVLDLSFVYIGRIPDSVGQLIHLRYLDLSWNGLTMLPSTICSLHHLQYLILSKCGRLKELPKELGKLIRLRHLQIDWCRKLSEMPQGLADLTSLVTLDRLIVHSSSGGLRYLESLDNLSGSLTIELPETEWKNAAIDARDACLSKKHRLQKLHIQWESEALGAADTVMNALQPHGNLEYLHIDTFGGEKMPCWIRELHNLVSLTIQGCGRCVELPSLRCLQFLKVLIISRMSSMVVIEEDDIGIMYDPDPIFFPSLETLSICEMPNLKSWWKQAPSIQPAFRRLTEVTIWGCPKLTTCMPLFSQVEDLELFDIQEKLFWQVIGSDVTSKLKTLIHGSIYGLMSLSGAQIRHLSALRRMELGSYACQPIVRRLLGVEYLTSLQELAIFKSKEVYLSWGDVLGLPHLHILKFYGLENVIDVGSTVVQRQPSSPLRELVIEHTSREWLEGIPWKSFPSLCSLTFKNITNLEAPPQGIQHLTALQDLQFSLCERLASFPCWMTRLSSLRSLRISFCSDELKERCKRPAGEDWPNIHHIQHIEIDYRKI